MTMLERLVAQLTRLIFSHRAALLLALAVLTVVMGALASRLHMTAGFGKQLPLGHEYTETFQQYQGQLFGANRLVVVVQARKGEIWTPAVMAKLSAVTQAVLYLPGVDRRSVASLWTPNTRVMQVTEEGYEARDVIGGDVTPERLDAAAIARIRDNVIQGGYVGSLVANDFSGAMVTADLLEVDPATKQPLDTLALGRSLEAELRTKFEDAQVEIRIIGFAKQISDVADGANSVMAFFGLAFVLTALAVYWYCRSWAFTATALVCSLTSLVWQFGSLSLLGYGLDPLAVLVPFLVFAIGVSHGVQQINAIARGIGEGQSVFEASRASFGALLVPGTMALVTAFVGFATLLLIPIPMIRELAITASLGVAYKIITNLVMLPVVASYVRLGADYGATMQRLRVHREGVVAVLGRVAEPGNARKMVAFGLLLTVAAIWAGHDRVIGTVRPGAPELREDARYNRDAVGIASTFSVGLDVLTVVVEAPADSCHDFARMSVIDDLAWQLANTEGVIGTAALPQLVKLGAAGFNEGNPKWGDMPRDARSMASFIGLVGEGSGLYDPRCTVLPVHAYLADHKASTISRVVDVVKDYRQHEPLGELKVRLASGNAGVQGATNEVLAATELPMMLYVYATIVALVALTYRDWRAVVACCVPLTVATFVGYWFMKVLDIGLTVATLPVMVLAVGIGVDYAFYIYNRLQLHLADGLSIVPAFHRALTETGMATIFTALTLSVGVATWVFSPLKFQADMGLLLAFMFMLNMVMAITLLPALAVLIDLWIPRRGPVRRPFMAH